MSERDHRENAFFEGKVQNRPQYAWNTTEASGAFQSLIKVLFFCQTWSKLPQKGLKISEEVFKFAIIYFRMNTGDHFITIKNLDAVII